MENEQGTSEEGDDSADVDESALEDLRTLVDLFLDEEEEKKDDDFLIFLRLSPVPEYLVKGYDFKMLNKQDHTQFYPHFNTTFTDSQKRRTTSLLPDSLTSTPCRRTT